MKSLSRALLTLLVLASIAASQAVNDVSSQPFKDAQKKAYLSYTEPLLPSLTALRFLSLHDYQLAADTLWLQNIQYYGQGNPYGTFPSMPKILDLITKLDPKFEYPYEFAMVVLPFMGFKDEAVQIGERAQQAHPNNGLLTFYLASDYHLFKKDYAKAAYYYQKAIEEPGSPSGARQLAATALNSVNTKPDDLLVARDYWKVVYDHATNDDDKKTDLNWISQLQTAYDLEQQIINYKNHFGYYPATLQALVDTHFIPSIPDSPVNHPFVLDPSTGKISFDKYVAPKQ